MITQVFYDKLVPIKYGETASMPIAEVESAPKPSPATDALSAHNGGPASSSGASPAVPPPASTVTADAMTATPSYHSNSASNNSAVSTTVPAASNTAAHSATATPTASFAVQPQAAITPEKDGVRAGAGVGREGEVLRVAMSLSNEMPEFVVVKSKYEEAVRYPWRSEMHIQMTSLDAPGSFFLFQPDVGGRFCQGMF